MSSEISYPLVRRKSLSCWKGLYTRRLKKVHAKSVGIRCWKIAKKLWDKGFNFDNASDRSDDVVRILTEILKESGGWLLESDLVLRTAIVITSGCLIQAEIDGEAESTVVDGEHFYRLVQTD